MRITENVVRKAAEFTESFTFGAFKFHGVGRDLGHGARYFDGVRQQVWLGKGAGQEAAAYYIGGALGWVQATGTMIPEDMTQYLQEVQRSYQKNGKTLYWENQGRVDAEFRAERDGKAVPRDK